MPAKSQQQFKFMAAAAHNPKFAKKVGIKPSVASEYIAGQDNYKSLPFKKLRKAIK